MENKEFIKLLVKYAKEDFTAAKRLKKVKGTERIVLFFLTQSQEKLLKARYCIYLIKDDNSIPNCEIEVEEKLGHKDFKAYSEVKDHYVKSLKEIVFLTQEVLHKRKILFFSEWGLKVLGKAEWGIKGFDTFVNALLDNKMIPEARKALHRYLKEKGITESGVLKYTKERFPEEDPAIIRSFTILLQTLLKDINLQLKVGRTLMNISKISVRRYSKNKDSKLNLLPTYFDIAHEYVFLLFTTLFSQKMKLNKRTRYPNNFLRVHDKPELRKEIHQLNTMFFNNLLPIIKTLEKEVSSL